MMKNYITLLLVLSMLFPTVVFSQVEIKPQQKTTPLIKTDKDSFFKKERIALGGNADVLIGNYTYISISPRLAYYLTDNLAMGPGLLYSYSFIRGGNYDGTNYNAHEIGARLFAQYHFDNDIIEFLGNFAAYTEYEYSYLIDNYSSTNEINGNVYAGGGYFPRGSILDGSYILVLWKLNQTAINDYSGPYFRVGFQFGLFR